MKRFIGLVLADTVGQFGVFLVRVAIKVFEVANDMEQGWTRRKISPAFKNKLSACAVCGEVDEHIIHGPGDSPLPSGREYHKFVPSS